MLKTIFTRGFALSFAILGALLVSGPIRAHAQQDPGQAPEQYPGQPPEQQGSSQSAWNVARISFVQGDVQITVSGQNQPEQAVANMPITDNSSVQTGQDGQIEIEFGDGSVARLTPNSSLQLGRVGQDQADVQQLSGLAYYELNVGQGHPAFTVEFGSGAVVPAENTIFRLDLDSGVEVAVLSGGVQVSGNGIQTATVNENQSLTLNPNNGGGPPAVAQGITQNSWDQWNSDRDKEIAQEAEQQTPVRDDSTNADAENWNDLDAYGNWYPVPGTGNVWVPSGVDNTWDPFGYGYWGFYPTFGYVWISGYPWGWLPYHSGSWVYFSFGWGWVPGAPGTGWRPVVGVRGYPGYFIPARPVFRGRPAGGNLLVAINRGPQSTGPWGPGQRPSVIDHRASLNFNGREISPVAKTTVHAQAFGGSNRGTSPGVRAVLNNSVRTPTSRVPAESYRQSQPGQAPRTNSQPRITPYTPRQNSYTSPRSTYVQPRTMPSPHYSAPPRYSAPHNSPPPPPPRSSGGGHGRR